jgi:hypothetical protein
MNGTNAGCWHEDCRASTGWPTVCLHPAPPPPGVNLYITTCIHGVDLRVPRCYLCRPEEEGALLTSAPIKYHVRGTLFDSDQRGRRYAVDLPYMNGAELIAAERKRQIAEEGYDAEHDRGGATFLALAGAAYAIPDQVSAPFVAIAAPRERFWPWHKSFWKPTPDDRVRELTKAGALIAAAIDSLLAP